MVEEKKEKEAPVYLDGSAVNELLKARVPPSMQEKSEELIKAHQSNYRLHDDKVAVLDISTPMLSEIDAIPGFYDVLSEPREFTKQGLIVVDRYRVVINHIPTTQRIHSMNVVDVKEWMDSQKGKQMTGALGNEQQIAALMMRSSGSV